MGSMTLVKADLGIKRICPSCSARFYDLQKRPIECPKCAASFEPESLYKQRRPRQPEPEKAVVVTRERDEEEEVDAVEEEPQPKRTFDATGKIKFTSQDHRFLRALKIAVDDER